MRFLSDPSNLVNALFQKETAAPTLQPYQYEPLPGPHFVRLLDIQPEDGNIICSLHAFDLQKSPAYDALSYTWGDPRPPLLQHIAPAQFERRFSIICDGSTLSVTTNLYHALLRLRMMKQAARRRNDTVLHTRIWIDAICINQNDLSERSSQVAMMDEIYKVANTVFAWLGKEDKYTAPAFRLINHLSNIPKADYSRYKTLKLGDYGIPENDWEALVAFFRRAWFTRAWVVQEMVLAPRLVLFCGGLEISWDTLRKSSEFISETNTWRHLRILASQFSSFEDRIARSMVPPVGNGISVLANLKESIANGSMPIWSIIMLGRGFNATDPRDHVYATLGLIKEAQLPTSEEFKSQPPVPDYSKSPEAIFTDCAVFMLNESPNLFLLSTVEDRSIRSPAFANTLPSWVPDLTVRIQPEPLFQLSIGLCGPMWDPSNEGLGSTATGLPIDGRILCLNGAYFDTIIAVSGPLDQLEGDFNWVDILDFMKPLWHTQVSKTTFGDALWRTLIADVEPSRQHPANPFLGRAFAEMLVSRLVLLNVAPADPFPVQQYTSVCMKLFRGTWDQIREDPSAFGAGSADARKAASAERAKWFESEREYIKRRGGRKDEIMNLRERTYTALMELSSADNGVFLTPEQVHQVLNILSGPDSIEKTAIYSRIYAFRVAMRGIIGIRRLFRTTGNYLGIVAMSAREGDQIWILPGQNVPFSLRPVEDGQFGLVGEAYVHGIMHGEAAMNGELNFKDIEIV